MTASPSTGLVATLPAAAQLGLSVVVHAPAGSAGVRCRLRYAVRQRVAGHAQGKCAADAWAVSRLVAPVRVRLGPPRGAGAASHLHPHVPHAYMPPCVLPHLVQIIFLTCHLHYLTFRSAFCRPWPHRRLIVQPATGLHRCGLLSQWCCWAGMSSLQFCATRYGCLFLLRCCSSARCAHITQPVNMVHCSSVTLNSFTLRSIVGSWVTWVMWDDDGLHLVLDSMQYLNVSSCNHVTKWPPGVVP